MTRHGRDTVHLGLRDWMIIAGLMIPLVASYFQMSISIAEIRANQTHILNRLERMEDMP